MAAASGCSGKAACCFRTVQHRVRLLRWLLLRRGQPPAVPNMAACCFKVVQHRVRLLRWLLLRRGYALAQRRAVRELCVVVRSKRTVVVRGAARLALPGVWGTGSPSRRRQLVSRRPHFGYTPPRFGGKYSCFGRTEFRDGNACPQGGIPCLKSGELWWQSGGLCV
jgi:hypothetical protein